ncbi:MAG: glycosyltransferase family 39 protein [Thermoplasmata archaeon]|nr:glycosyltransferase family 39 protein [Thermoplasmata archaeon]
MKPIKKNNGSEKNEDNGSTSKNVNSANTPLKIDLQTLKQFLIKYKIHLGIFIIALLIRLSTMTIARGDDPMFYFLGAKNLLEGNGYTAFGGPIQYPMGQSLLIIPFFIVFGVTSEAAVLCSAVFGALSIVLLYVLIKDWSEGDNKAALIAAVIMTFSFVHWRYSTGVWSDMSGLFLITLAIYLALKYIKTEKPLLIYGFYFIFGLAVLVRYTNAFGFIIVLIMMVYSKKFYLLKNKEVWLGLIVLFLTVLPQLIYNQIYFDSIFASGYTAEVNINRYYVHPKYPGPLYSIDYIPEGIIWGARWVFLDFYFLTPILVPFYIVGLWFLVKRKNWEKITLALTWFIVFYIAFAVNGAHGFASLHQLIPVLPPLLLLGSLGLSSVYDRIKPIYRGINSSDKKGAQNASKLKRQSNLEKSKLKIRPLRLIVIIIILMLILAPMMVYGWIGIQYRNNEHRTRIDAILWVKEHSTEDDLIILGQRFAGFRYYSERDTISLEGWENENFTPREVLNPFDIYNTSELEYQISSHNHTYILVEVNYPLEFLKMNRGIELNETYGIVNYAPLKTFETPLPDDYGLANLMEAVGLENPLKPEIWEIYQLNVTYGK